MLVQSTRFGELTVEPTQVFVFEHGIPGFLEEKQFVLLPYEQESPFAFLQSMHNPDLTLLLVEPFTFFKEYDFVLEESVVAELEFSTKNPPQVWNVVRVPDKVEDMTANLLAPILLNRRTQKGMQVVLEKTTYTVRHRIFAESSKVDAPKGGR